MHSQLIGGQFDLPEINLFVRAIGRKQHRALSQSAQSNSCLFLSAQWYILLAGAVGGIVIGAATVLSLLAYTGKLAVAERRFVKLTESEEAGIQVRIDSR